MPSEGSWETAILLSSVVFLPAAAAVGLLIVPKRFAGVIKTISLADTLIVFLATVYLAYWVVRSPTVAKARTEELSEEETVLPIPVTTSPPTGLAKRATGPAEQTIHQIKLTTHPPERPTGQGKKKLGQAEDRIGQATERTAPREPDHSRPVRGPLLEQGGLGFLVRLPWIPAFGVEYFLGADGISLPLVLLTSLLSLLAMLASWRIDRHEKAYCILFLLLETGLLGVFLALDFFLFYVFWEVTLLPMYFLIGLWGGPRREYAAVKFFLFTLAGSVLMLVAMLMLYFASDVRLLSEQERVACHVGPLPVVARSETAAQANQPIHTFNLLALAALGQNRGLIPEAGLPLAGLEAGSSAAKWPQRAGAAQMVLPVSPSAGGATGQDPPGQKAAVEAAHSQRAISTGGQPGPLDRPLLWGRSTQWWAFLLLLVGFLVKVPSVPLHTWLPDAHVEAPTPISMLLAGVLLKMGGYGLLRIAYPICPQGGYELAWLVCGLGLVSMIYGALAAMAQKDFKRLVAYSSVSHMGYVVLGLGVWSATAARSYQIDAWLMSANGALFQMIAHGITSAGMFFLVGVIYDRVHHRNLDQMGGLMHRMPIFGALSIVIFFGAMGLPGLCGFVGEVLVLLGAWHYNHWMAALAAMVVILTAGYILWTVQRVYLGAEYRGPHPEALQPMSAREIAVAAPLAVLAVVLGVYPQAVFSAAEPCIRQTIQALADWTRQAEADRPQPVSFDSSETSPETRPRSQGQIDASFGADRRLRWARDDGLCGEREKAPWEAQTTSLGTGRRLRWTETFLETSVLGPNLSEISQGRLLCLQKQGRMRFSRADSALDEVRR